MTLYQELKIADVTTWMRGYRGNPCHVLQHRATPGGTGAARPPINKGRQSFPASPEFTRDDGVAAAVVQHPESQRSTERRHFLRPAGSRSHRSLLTEHDGKQAAS